MSLADRHERIMERCVYSLKTWKQVVLQNYENEQEANAELEKMKNIVKDHCAINDNYKRSQEALSMVQEKIDSSDYMTIDVNKLYEDCLNNLPESSNRDFQDNEIWEKVIGGVTDVVEVRTKSKKLDPTQYESLGDSLLCSNVFTPPVDPMTKKVIRNPYRNKRCNHVYEYNSIVDYIKQQRNRAKCPYIGCTNHSFRVTDLVADQVMASQITQHLATQGESSEDEEVI
ncbi:unnamed protein product [Acanthoscelides obtectus]|uniref:E3 SUMO-protein ligase NSE2 n=1 Tax=Acanthoscelides obtectus TaxID=200917 RepID=A0A9P0KM17_ACAOB|nr:unnamed protein product [Acanthoscelides obtectus]CAK1642680.1 E3 SUMO-protein ligase NSE2 [Acanthoscelides obtectus]